MTIQEYLTSTVQAWILSNDPNREKLQTLINDHLQPAIAGNNASYNLLLQFYKNYLMPKNSRHPLFASMNVKEGCDACRSIVLNSYGVIYRKYLNNAR